MVQWKKCRIPPALGKNRGLQFQFSLEPIHNHNQSDGIRYCVQLFPPFLSFKPHYSCLNEASTYINIKEKQLNPPIQILVTSSLVTGYWWSITPKNTSRTDHPAAPPCFQVHRLARHAPYRRASRKGFYHRTRLSGGGTTRQRKTHRFAKMWSKDVVSSMP
jgi:hypothetical protein